MTEYVPGTPVVPGRSGVLLLNLGTPDAPEPGPVRRYLRQFLSDPRVVELPRLLWLPLLYLVILVVRPRRSARAYRAVWRDDGSPLLVFSRRLADKVRAALAPDVPVALGMTYGEPSVGAALDELAAAGCERVVCLPLYPQHSGSTTGAAYDALFAALSRRRRVPALRTISGYATHPAYIAALAASVREAWEDGRPERLLLSFHGVPVRYVDQGDPYRDECLATAARLREALGLSEEESPVAFQSRFGREEWLSPSTEDTLVALGAAGCASVDVLCPGFAVDCLETLEEIAIEGEATFRAAGGGRLRAIPCLDDRDDHAHAIAAIARSELGISGR